MSIEGLNNSTHSDNNWFDSETASREQFLAFIEEQRGRLLTYAPDRDTRIEIEEHIAELERKFRQRFQ